MPPPSFPSRVIIQRPSSLFAGEKLSTRSPFIFTAPSYIPLPPLLPISFPSRSTPLSYGAVAFKEDVHIHTISPPLPERVGERWRGEVGWGGVAVGGGDERERERASGVSLFHPSVQCCGPTGRLISVVSPRAAAATANAVGFNGVFTGCLLLGA